MSDQTNNGKNANENQSGQGMNSIVEFCQKNTELFMNWNLPKMENIARWNTAGNITEK